MLSEDMRMNHEHYHKQVLLLAEELSLQYPVKELLKNCCARLPWEYLKEKIVQLTDIRYAENAQIQLAEELKAYHGKDGMAELAVMLAAAIHTREKYRDMKISDQIYLDTMGCFRRFLDETKKNTGDWKFDRAFWTWRQTAGCLFRLGTLEFEYTKCFWDAIPNVSKNDMLISVHIPSDASLTKENLSFSYHEMKHFFWQNEDAVCYNGIPKAVVCHTWLLSPNLLKFLKEDSNIRLFAADYEILQTDADNSGCLEWLFEGMTDIKTLPEKTALQKEVKKHFLQGGIIGQGLGWLKKGL